MSGEMNTAELVARAEALLPAIAERALQTDRDRRVPQETIDEIRAARLNQVMQATRWGLGLDFDAFFEIAWRLASACGSTGWVYSVTAVQTWELGLAPEAAQEECFSTANIWSCSAFNPRGAVVEPADGGWALKGRWQYSSGCLHADWAMLGAVVPEFSSPVLLLVPREEFRIEDTWHVSGLRGTGSNDVLIEEPIFVPSHRYVPLDGSDAEAASRGCGSYGAPAPSITPWGLAAAVIGMAQGALDSYERATRTRVSSFGGQEVAKMVGPQIRVSDAAATLDAARALARSDIRELIERGARGEEFSDEDRVRIRRDHAYVVNLCYDATMAVARAAGASSLFEANPIQRFMRDVHAGAMQVALNWDEQAESYGRVRMGMEPNGQMW